MLIAIELKPDTIADGDISSSDIGEGRRREWKLAKGSGFKGRDFSGRE